MKAKGSFASVIKGVSQQAPADRLEGQHGEMVNMLADPVRGLTRRNGMIVENFTGHAFSADPGDALTDSYSYRVFSYRDTARDYDVLHRTRAKVGDSDGHLDTLLVHRKSEGLMKFLDVRRPDSDDILDNFEANGISAITSIGSYVLFASNGLQPTYTTSDEFHGAFSGSVAVWVRGGSYARTYTVQARRKSDGANFSVTYTTPQSTYPGVLNLSAIPPLAVGSPYEQYFVNILQADYDTHVNQWASSASAAIVPSAIAVQLATLLNGAGFGGWSVIGSHMVNDNCSYIEVSDGGNGDFMRAVLSDVKATNEVTDIHRVGKVLRVQPGGNSDSYYIKAFPKVEGSAAAYQEVIWREDAGVIQTPFAVLGMGRVVDDQFFWAGTPERLQTLFNDNGVILTVPTFAPSTAGDDVTSKPPHFFGPQPITMLTTFQDRLLIGSNSVINVSERGDYFNFYRTTMLTIPASDPTEITAVGTESDTLRKAVTYDRNLMIAGDKFHYAINGKQPFDASNPQMSTQFALANAADAQPVGIGKFVYMLKEDTQLAASRMMEIRAGVYQDSPELNDVAKPLRDYINGSPAEIVALSNPNAVFVRTEHFLRSKGGFPRARPWGLYLYQFLEDDNGQRIQEAWSAWEWSSTLGTPIGISQAGSGDSLLVYTIAFGTWTGGGDAGAGGDDGPVDPGRGVAVFVQRASARPDPNGLPYLDGLRHSTAAATSGMWTPDAMEEVKAVVYTSPSGGRSYSPVPAVTDADRFVGLEDPNYTVGDAPPETVDDTRWTGVNGYAADYNGTHPDSADADILWTGLAFPAFVDLTNPFIRTREGKAKTDGTMNLINFTVTLTRTAGFKSSWIDHDGTVNLDGFREEYARIRYNQDVFIGREAKDVQVRLEAVDWLPLTINAIAWKGNWFQYQSQQG